jgi:hypothetical protein
MIKISDYDFDRMTGGQWPVDSQPASQKLICLAVWKALGQQHGSRELHLAALLAGTIQCARLSKFYRDDLRAVS